MSLSQICQAIHNAQGWECNPSQFYAELLRLPEIHRALMAGDVAAALMKPHIRRFIMQYTNLAANDIEVDDLDIIASDLIRCQQITTQLLANPENIEALATNDNSVIKCAALLHHQHQHPEHYNQLRDELIRQPSYDSRQQLIGIMAGMTPTYFKKLPKHHSGFKNVVAINDKVSEWLSRIRDRSSQQHWQFFGKKKPSPTAANDQSPDAPKSPPKGPRR